MDYLTDSLTIERINNDRGYSPDNCEWITLEEQQHNRSNLRLSANDIPIIRIMRNDGFMVDKIASLFGVRKGVIEKVIYNQTWADC